MVTSVTVFDMSLSALRLLQYLVMPVPDEVLHRAMKNDRDAMEAMLAEVYPSVYRFAHALTGRPGAARQVLHDVLRRSLRVIPKWRRGTTPENWYYHHTLITARSL